MQVLQAHPGVEQRIQGIRLTGPTCTRVTGIARRSERGMTKLAQEFYDFVWDYFIHLDQEVRRFLDAYFARR